jgi:DNA-binding MarR family transcriptional regulator
VELERSQGELAAELGTTRSTLNRALHDFEELHLVTVVGTELTIRKPDGLRFYLA